MHTFCSNIKNKKYIYLCDVPKIRPAILLQNKYLLLLFLFDFVLFNFVLLGVYGGEGVGSAQG